ncbi:MAG: hypothetical protein ACI3W5_07085 [Faecousia sp.]
MKVEFLNNEKLSHLDCGSFSVPFLAERYGFYVEQDGEQKDVELLPTEDGFAGKLEELHFFLSYLQKQDHLELCIKVENRGEANVERIGFRTGVDSYMESYPQWNDKFFPTLLRCEKTHLWGYYMNTAENALAIATEGPVASYDIRYNMLSEEECGHRILGTDILFFQDTVLPARHPQNLKKLKKGSVYTNKIYFIPVEKKCDIKAAISRVADVPVVDADKYTLEPGEDLKTTVLYEGNATQTLILPDGSILDRTDGPLTDFGLYRLSVKADNGKECEAVFYVRKSWDHYLKAAARNALSKPPKATTHTESFYGFFSCFLDYKHTHDETIGSKAYEAFEETMPYMFDFDKCEPIVIPNRIQNTSCMVSLLVDMYEADPLHQICYLERASRLGDFLMRTQDTSGAYRNGATHYTCVVYIAKSMLELVQAEQAQGSEEWNERAKRHFDSAKRAVDELVANLDNIETEGEMTLEDGMLACSALQIGMLALMLPEEERMPYIAATEYMMKLHSCLEQQLIPDCRMNGGSLRYWESQYDVMIRANMMNSPHGWTGWTGYAYYYLYLLTGKKSYLLNLMNLMGSCVQLIDDNDNLRWAFCGQPYIRALTFVPDPEKEVTDGYSFVDTEEKAYRGKYEVRELTEQYVDMISGWYRTGAQKVTGGYEFCPLIYENGRSVDVDNQGGCCDNDVHEIFKCMEETVLKKAFLYEDEDGLFLSFGCKVKISEGKLIIEPASGTETLSYNLRNSYYTNLSVNSLQGFGMISIPSC